ncbi:MAG: baseplate J/gp47 family protein [Myxococcota bacterium]
MTFVRPSLEEIIDRVRQDFETKFTNAAVRLRKTVEDVIARSLAGVSHGLHGHAASVYRQQFPQTADPAGLALWAEMLGVERRIGEFSRGIVISNANGFVPIGHVLVSTDGQEFEIEYEIDTLPGQQAEFHIKARERGREGNLPALSTLTFQPAWGAHTEATIANPGLDGGFGPESDSQFKDRVVRRLALPVQGGTERDFVTWALEVPGVLRATTTVNAAGEVDLYPLDVASDGFSPSVPSFERLQTIQEYIDERTPVGFVCDVTTPQALAANFTIRIDDGDTTEVRQQIQLALLDYFGGLNVGDDVILSQVSAAISSVPGERDHTILSPATNVVTDIPFYRTLGAITWA